MDAHAPEDRSGVAPAANESGDRLPRLSAEAADGYELDPAAHEALVRSNRETIAQLRERRYGSATSLSDIVSSDRKFRVIMIAATATLLVTVLTETSVFDSWVLVLASTLMLAVIGVSLAVLATGWLRRQRRRD